MVSRELNLQAIWDQPTFLWIPEPATIYKDVFAVPPGVSWFLIRIKI